MTHMAKRDFAGVNPGNKQLARASSDDATRPPFNVRGWETQERMANYSLMVGIDILFEREQYDNPLTDDIEGYAEPRESRCYTASDTPSQFKFRGL